MVQQKEFHYGKPADLVREFSPSGAGNAAQGRNLSI
jgi:hypothetical protein